LLKRALPQHYVCPYPSTIGQFIIYFINDIILKLIGALPVPITLMHPPKLYLTFGNTLL
jgi:hypothetical protein